MKSFAQRFNIIERRQAGKKELWEIQLLQSNLKMTFHLGKMEVAYENGLDQRNIENYDKTNFVFDT